MTKTAFLTQTDINYIKKLRQSTLTILNTSKSDWSCEEILRFLALLKIQSKLQNVIYEIQITGEQLFDPHYLYQNLTIYLQQEKYFPIMKLISIVNQINCLDRKQALGQKIEFQKKQLKKNPFEKQSKLKTKNGLSHNSPTKNSQVSMKKQSSKDNYSNNICQYEDTSEVDLCVNNDAEDQSYVNTKPLEINGEQIKKIKEELLKIGDTSIIQLSNIQLVKLFKATQIKKLVEFADLIKRLSLDGFIFIYLFSQKKIFLPEIQTHLSQQTISSLNYIYNLLLPQYIRQGFQQKVTPKLPLTNHIENYEIQFYDLKQNFTSNDFNKHQNFNRKPTDSFRESFRGSQCGKSQYGQSQYGQSEFGQSQQAASQYGSSEFGSSQVPNQQYASSEYVHSQRGSIRNSMAESFFGESQECPLQTVKEKQQKIVNPNIRVSSIQDTSIVKKLKAAALSLPFNLFNLEPLQFIKITTISFPFSLHFLNKPTIHEEMVNIVLKSLQKEIANQALSNNFISKQFNLTGARFGRNQQNDFRFPDELSISGKHAHIIFLDNKYKLIDLGSKTGTFLYIPLTRPLKLVDQHIIQLSNQIQIIVHIIKKDKNEGTIKIEFNRPENQPFYKASLKNNQTLRIGRNQKCHIKLPHQSLSSKHCQIKYINQNFIIYDCLSTTGTWVRLSKKNQKSDGFQVKKGDIIRISSKKTYVIQDLAQDIFQEEDQIPLEQQKQLQKYFQNPNFNAIRKANSEDKFSQIIENAWDNKKISKKVQINNK